MLYQGTGELNDPYSIHTYTNFLLYTHKKKPNHTKQTTGDGNNSTHAQ